jgi:hypothetical protein
LLLLSFQAGNRLRMTIGQAGAPVEADECSTAIKVIVPLESAGYAKPGIARHGEASEHRQQVE